MKRFDISRARKEVMASNLEDKSFLVMANHLVAER